MNFSFFNKNLKLDEIFKFSLRLDSRSIKYLILEKKRVYNFKSISEMFYLLAYYKIFICATEY